MTLFSNRRRILGAALLVLLLVLMTGWLRSLGHEEVIHLCPTRTLNVLASANGTLCLVQLSLQTQEQAEAMSGTIKASAFRRFHLGYAYQRSEHQFSETDFMGEPGMVSTEIRWTWGSFVFGRQSYSMDGPTDGLRVMVIVAPYWSIVIPLTLLAGWLLLSRPPRVGLQKEQYPLSGVAP